MSDNHTHDTNVAHTHSVSNTVYPPYQTQPTVCPTCGRCPTCGAGGSYYQPYRWNIYDTVTAGGLVNTTLPNLTLGDTNGGNDR